MKKNISLSIFLVLIAVMLISSLGQSQAIAGDEPPVQEELSDITGVAPIPEPAPDIEETEGYFVDEIPQVAAGQKRVVISGWNLQPWNRSWNNRLLPYGWGCLGTVTQSGQSADYTTTYFPFSLPIGSKITNVYWTGTDWVGSTANAELKFWIEREHWKGKTADNILFDSTGSMYSSGEPFNKYKAVNHTVVDQYSYQIRIDIYSSSELKYMHVCQITIDYIEPSPFVNAIPVIVNNK